jgi:hypothetical protein
VESRASLPQRSRLARFTHDRHRPELLVRNRSRRRTARGPPCVFVVSHRSHTDASPPPCPRQEQADTTQSFSGFERTACPPYRPGWAKGGNMTSPHDPVNNLPQKSSPREFPTPPPAPRTPLALPYGYRDSRPRSPRPSPRHVRLFRPPPLARKLLLPRPEPPC